MRRWFEERSRPAVGPTKDRVIGLWSVVACADARPSRPRRKGSVRPPTSRTDSGGREKEAGQAGGVGGVAVRGNKNRRTWVLFFKFVPCRLSSNMALAVAAAYAAAVGVEIIFIRLVASNKS